MARPTERLTRRQERKLLKAGKRVFAEQFPNPERIGCPGPDVLRAMARRRWTADGRPYPVEHLTMCSPCFREYSSYRTKAQFLKGAHIALIAATVVLAFGALLWLLLGRLGGVSPRRNPEIAQHPPVPPFQAVTLDLRLLSAPRGERGPESGRPTLAIPRGRLRISLLLPVGSEEGQYEVRLLDSDAHPALSLRGQARIVDYVTTLRAETDLRMLRRGTYTLQLRRTGFSWVAYPVVLE